MSIKKNVRNATLIAGFTAAGLVGGQNIQAQTKDSTAQGTHAAANIGLSEDPNFPAPGGAKVIGKVRFDWVAKPGKPPVDVSVRSADPDIETGDGSYQGMKDGTTFLNVHGRIIQITKSSVTKLAVKDEPDVASLDNSRHRGNADNTTTVASNTPQTNNNSGISGGKAFGGDNSGKPAGSAKGVAGVAAKDVTITAKAAGVYTLTYADPDTKASKSVDVKRILPAQLVATMKTNSAMKTRILAVMDAQGIKGDFVQLEGGKIPETFTSFTIGLNGDLTIHPPTKDPLPGWGATWREDINISSGQSAGR